ncbi:hypothetical protein HC248_03443 [Polaromonas vacuolata]|uniref:DUF1631 domain-containing protein n=1 Tax=Polaromonas vacuolata TaxID=37448 RepID=A0A6H2HF68_9BURK|nr:DUF1631 family protein [Polaromonas vacuolata]QJC58106.1 hypothetical protein HC248_03443 [Polaromonas vacuolata]
MSQHNAKKSHLALSARELFIEQAGRAFPELAQAISDQLQLLSEQAAPPFEIQLYRDGLLAFRAHHQTWFNGVSLAWQKACANSVVVPSPSSFASSVFKTGGTQLELMDDAVVENKILASRLALRVMDLASWELNDLRLRIRELEGSTDLQSNDILRPEVISQHLVTQWLAARLPRELWVRLQDLLQDYFSHDLLNAYHASNAFLIAQGVMPDIDLRPLVRRTPSSHAGSSTAHTNQAGLGLEGEVSVFTQRVLRSNQTGQRRLDGEDALQVTSTPLKRARMRALGVMGHLRRLVGARLDVEIKTSETVLSPGLKQAMAVAIMPSTLSLEQTQLIYADSYITACGTAQLEQVAGRLRKTSNRLKKAASNATEKATIEIVALMFQSILSEERIPPVIRVWFARLQMPVLRVAIADVEFFDSLQHPARRLIDRIGSCVLGFDVAVAGGAMECEIRRVVQVIEQYPDVGRQVFEQVFQEFELFLSKFLSVKGRAARVISVAQQIEQKEIMVILYTIELRNMLNDMPVHDEIQGFLFKVWAETMAISAMQKGPQHDETIRFKQAAVDLVWAASAKPDRNDRAKVIAELPMLLQLLRHGMGLLSMSAESQDAYIKTISDILADAFMSKTDFISPERIGQLAKRLINLEDYLSDEDVGDLPLDADSLFTLMGIDASDLEIITDGGGQFKDAMRAWALELEIGSWFSLDHNGRISRVQFAWRSERKQLYLFAASDGRNFLIQLRRLSAYLHAGLLVPTEDETLTMRATREALGKLDANPERLLN